MDAGHPSDIQALLRCRPPVPFLPGVSALGDAETMGARKLHLRFFPWQEIASKNRPEAGRVSGCRAIVARRPDPPVRRLREISHESAIPAVFQHYSGPAAEPVQDALAFRDFRPPARSRPAYRNHGPEPTSRPHRPLPRSTAIGRRRAASGRSSKVCMMLPESRLLSTPHTTHCDRD